MKGLYYSALLNWIVGICLVPLTLLFRISSLWLVGSFLCSFVLCWLLINRGVELPRLSKTYRGFDRFLGIFLIVLLIPDAVAFVSIILAGGGPELVDGIRCLVSHGEVVTQNISPAWFLYLTLCETFMGQIAHPLIPATFILFLSHIKYAKTQEELS